MLNSKSLKQLVDVKNIPNLVEESLEYILSINKEYFSKELAEKIENLYSHFEDNLLTSPASSKPTFHAAFNGGYIVHVANVIRNVIKLYNLYVKNEIWEKELLDKIDIKDCIFAAEFHDLHKLGWENGKVMYKTCTNDWKRKNYKTYYDLDKEMEFMDHTDKTFFLLQRYNIPYNLNQFYGIKLADGAFDKSTHSYLVDNFNTYINVPRLPIGVLVHHADYLSTINEYFLYHKINLND